MMIIVGCHIKPFFGE